jgi:Flp pilus assembly pilin Flp
MTRLVERLRSDERGVASAALEMLLVVGFLILPMMAGLAQVPRWIDATSTADLAAQEAARQMALADTYADGRARGDLIAGQIVQNHGFPAGMLVSVIYALDPATPAATLTRGRTVTATVTVSIDPFFVPGVGAIGSPVTFSRSASERIDDFREF